MIINAVSIINLQLKNLAPTDHKNVITVTFPDHKDTSLTDGKFNFVLLSETGI